MNVKSENMYQAALIFFGIMATVFFGVFFLREIYPEYKLYQDAYSEMEQFRSTYTGKPVPDFKREVKQILLPQENLGAEVIDRCISCHVALKFSHFSPTKVATNDQGHPLVDKEGKAVLEPNNEYVWKKLEEKITDLRHPPGKGSPTKAQLAEADHLESLKSVQVGEHLYDMTKVLRAHPLIGKEVRPFQYHDIDEYGCASCHSGNGRGLTADKAHGPIYDGEYEVVFTGHKHQFLETDPKNDPPFSKVFNYKPGESLIFQTTPLLVGNLIQARCVQCHEPVRILPTSSKSNEVLQSVIPVSTQLTKTYQQGEFLFFSQSCYACHRISGLARGGVGPELTLIGKNYPWYIKESIVWPQADLPTSTMPNMHLDHEELEELVTFLMAQRGENFHQSMMNRRVGIKNWEEGRRELWEKPLPPAEVKDLNQAMMIYATEGCAACHRLQGFTSSVGFASEKGKDPHQIFEDKLWFRKYFPEEIPGSVIIERIQELGEEIDKKIVDGVRENQILEEIDKSHPKALEAFYSNFKFAMRSKDHEDVALNEKEKKAWKERLHRLMMMFIQEYGLGRQIGPRLSWSGVYRSRQWLMEHFWNPASHSARSIMPVFSFDDSKFLSLTYMLEELGKRNAAQLKMMWDLNGFNPVLAYEMQCAQCHGDYLQGNGPVAEWIYPIPKNLRNFNFLRNLTRGRVEESIDHGIRGGPMAPWGEVAADHEGGHPVMNDDQIEHLVDWIFQSLPEIGVEDQSVIAKWKYYPEDLLKEMKDEGNILKGKASATEETIFDRRCEQVFDTKAPLECEKEKSTFYIKTDYYTPENIAAGNLLFHMNCAVCHGNEADGSGVRAGVMEDAKPRMLTNLDWLHTRDDLRLLRSIKFGVPGTSMTPWGDVTTSLQRLQLVIYIRSLTKDGDMQGQLKDALYRAFDDAKWRVEIYRGEGHDDPDLAGLKPLLDEESKQYLMAGRGVIDTVGDSESFRLFLKIIALNDNRFSVDNNVLKMAADPGKEIRVDIDQIKAAISTDLDQDQKKLQAAEAELPSEDRQKKLEDLHQKIKKTQDLNAKLDALVLQTAKLREKQKNIVEKDRKNEHGK